MGCPTAEGLGRQTDVGCPTAGGLGRQTDVGCPTAGGLDRLCLRGKPYKKATLVNGWLWQVTFSKEIHEVRPTVEPANKFVHFLVVHVVEGSRLKQHRVTVCPNN